MCHEPFPGLYVKDHWGGGILVDQWDLQFLTFFVIKNGWVMHVKSFWWSDQFIRQLHVDFTYNIWQLKKGLIKTKHFANCNWNPHLMDNQLGQFSGLYNRCFTWDERQFYPCHTKTVATVGAQCFTNQYQTISCQHKEESLTHQNTKSETPTSLWGLRGDNTFWCHYEQTQG